MAADRTELALAAALGVALSLVAFVTGSSVATDGVANAPSTWTEIALVIVGAGLAAWLLAGDARGRAWGWPSVALFGALTALTALSIVWSVQPDQSWIAAGQTLSYLAVFGGAWVLARLLPARWQAAAGGLALAAVAVSAWAVLVKALALSVDQQPDWGRLMAPFDYQNATGLIAALGVAPALWAASARDHGRVVRAVATAGLTLLITVVVMTYSRSAEAAAACGVAVVLGLCGVRLRALLMLAVAGAGAAIVCGWALSDHALTSGSGVAGVVAPGARSAADHTFGLLLAVGLAFAAAAGAGAGMLADRTRLSEQRRRRIGVALLGLLALVPVIAVAALAASHRGFTGEISHLWSRATSTSGAVGANPSRLLSTASSRPRYWHQGWSVGTHHLLVGAGANTFGVAHLPYRSQLLVASAPTAHSYVVETFADFGLIGVALNLALLFAWLAAVRHPLRGRGVEAARPERDALVALLGTVVAFGVGSAIDWTWFIPGVTVPALFAAGWLAGRGPLVAAADRPARVAAAPARPRRPLLSRPGALAGLTGLALATLALCYAVWQPLRSAQAVDAAGSAAAAGRLGEALTDARDAVAYFPVSLSAIQTLAALEHAAGLDAAAEAELVHGTRVQPSNPAAWTWLGQYELSARNYLAAEVAYRRAAGLVYGTYGAEVVRAADLEASRR